MKVFVFSIGEKTTDVCCQILEEYGYEVILLKDKTSLAEKLQKFYKLALETGDKEVMRIDADILPYPWMVDMKNEKGWTCASGFDWYKQNIGAISIHLMNRKVLKLCDKYSPGIEEYSRTETHLWRLPEINSYTSVDSSVRGIHGFGQHDQRERIKSLKKERNQEYDWALVERIENV